MDVFLGDISWATMLSVSPLQDKNPEKAGMSSVLFPVMASVPITVPGMQ